VPVGLTITNLIGNFENNTD